MQKAMKNMEKQASKPKPLTHKHKASLKAMKKGVKSHIINFLLTSFVRKPQANTFPYRPRIRLISNQQIYIL